ncbi:MAG: C1 family peptidase [Stenomitos rutilans HA7619-LM2]|jgi:C1A family cysteine protease|nr:C1 family peptidase [Stenomitos rutilans HA7619-LM2]
MPSGTDDEKRQKIDWKKKGLGWIPDYPDLRDYHLESENINTQDGRLKKEETNQELEQIADFLFQLSDIFVNDSSSISEFIDQKIKGERNQQRKNERLEYKKNLQKVQANLGELRKKVFGEIRFMPVKVHKILKGGVQVRNPYASDEFKYESDLPNRVLSLRKFLYILKSKGKLELLDESILNELDAILDWLTNIHFSIPSQEHREKIPEIFDDITQQLIMRFQFCTSIAIDGEVGLETYTTLEEYLNRFSKNPPVPAISAYEDRLKCKEEFQKIYENLKSDSIISGRSFPEYQNKVKLVSPPSLIPSDVIQAIQDRLIHWATISIKEDSDIYEEKTLENIQIKSDHISIFRTLNFDRSTLKELSSEVSEKGVVEKIFQREFLIIEPIISVVLKFLSPLALYRNRPLESVVIEGMDIFAQLFQTDVPLNRERQESKDLAIKALYTVKKQLNYELAALICKESGSPIQKGHESYLTLLFYFLILKILEKFKSDKDGKNDIFEKKEMLEIVRENVSVQSGKAQIFSTARLYIPVSDNFYNSLEQEGLLNPNAPKPFIFLPGVVDLSYWCSEIEDQRSFNSCTAFAVISLVEYFTNRSAGKYTDISPLFLYKVTRHLMNLQGDVGASVRETMKAMALFGAPPEQYWSYDEHDVDEEPPAFCYSFARNFQALKYLRLDYAGISKEDLLLQVKAVLSVGFPCVFGFTLYTSAYEDSNPEKGMIPFPNYKKDRVVSGHSVVAVGYDDYKELERTDRPNQPSVGALLIRNSLGSEWGQGGYGWLPYDYVLGGLTADWWSLLKARWFGGDDFWWKTQGTGEPSWRPPQP